MKAIIKNRIFLECDKPLYEALKENLTYSIPQYNKPNALIINTRKHRKDVMSIPSGRVDLIPEDYEVIDRRTIVPMEFPEFLGTLRPSQQEVYDLFNDSGILNAWVSFGKTFTALAIMAKLGQRSLVVTHTTGLRDQWVQEVRKVFGIEAGIIGPKSSNLDSPIVIANVQSLQRRVEEVKDAFGTICLDEMHHLSASTFTKVLDNSSARYKIGLSGTVVRKDGKHVVFEDYFGPVKFKPPQENYIEPKVHVYKFKTKLVDSSLVPWATKINKLLEDTDYVDSIGVLAYNYMKLGHKVLVVADRVQMLEYCAEALGKSAVCITGGVKQDQRQELIDKVKTGEASILFGTQSMFSEGISINELSCLILATPINNTPLLTQLIGRVIREQEGKPTPIIVDINLKGIMAKNQANMRLKHYLDNNWKVEFVEL